MYLPTTMMFSLLTFATMSALLGCKASHASSTKDVVALAKIPGMPMRVVVQYNNRQVADKIGIIYGKREMLVPNVDRSMGDILRIVVQDSANSVVTFSGRDEILWGPEIGSDSVLLVGEKLAPFVQEEADPRDTLKLANDIKTGASVTIQGFGVDAGGTFTPRGVSGSVTRIFEESGDIDAVFPDTDSAPTTDATIVNEDRVVVAVADISTKKSEDGRFHVRAAPLLGKRFAWVRNLIPGIKKSGDNAKESVGVEGSNQSDSADAPRDTERDPDSSNRERGGASSNDRSGGSFPR